MIVEPDFLDHWKTRLLARLLGTELAPIYVLRLWAHCQQRKTDRFTGWNPDVLASVCRWDGDGKTLWDAMLQTYLEQDGEHVVARGWSECNAGLVSAWENGKKGGRPPKSKSPEPIGNRPVIPSETEGQTDRVDRIDGIEETEKTTPQPPKGGEATTKAQRFTPPSREELDLAASKLGLPSVEVDRFVSYYGSNGWRVGRHQMKSWQHALTGWKLRWEERKNEHRGTGSGGTGGLTPAERRNATMDPIDVANVRANAIASAERDRKRLEEDPDYVPF